jgi:hypothetical protein
VKNRGDSPAPEGCQRRRVRSRACLGRRSMGVGIGAVFPGSVSDPGYEVNHPIRRASVLPLVPSSVNPPFEGASRNASFRGPVRPSPFPFHVNRIRSRSLRPLTTSFRANVQALAPLPARASVETRVKVGATERHRRNSGLVGVAQPRLVRLGSLRLPLSIFFEGSLHIWVDIRSDPAGIHERSEVSIPLK